MRKEISFEDKGYVGYVPVVIYYDDNNQEFDRTSINMDSEIDKFTSDDLSELVSLSKDKLIADLDLIYNSDLSNIAGNPDAAFKKHKNNYLNIIKIKHALKGTEYGVEVDG
jgi:hypothetical protein